MRLPSAVLAVSLGLAACGPAPWPGPAPGSGKCTVETYGAPFTCVVHTQPINPNGSYLTLWPGTNDVGREQPVAYIYGEVLFLNGVFVGGECQAHYDLGLHRDRPGWQSTSCRITTTSSTRTSTGFEVHGKVEATLKNPEGGTQKLYGGF